MDATTTHALPLLDRIDIHIEVPRLPWKGLAEEPEGECSAVIRARVDSLEPGPLREELHKDLENMTRIVNQVLDIADRADVRFDYYCWDLYARVTEWYEADKARLEVRAHAERHAQHRVHLRDR